ncbi:Uncharacterised protein [Bordetella pertussis]|nr:Uncharacterised protein [Bordetella pertussis]
MPRQDSTACVCPRRGTDTRCRRFVRRWGCLQVPVPLRGQAPGPQVSFPPQGQAPRPRLSCPLRGQPPGRTPKNKTPRAVRLRGFEQ